MKHTLFTIALALLLPCLAWSFIMPPKLFQIVEYSSIISYAKIISVGEKDFKVLTLRGIKACEKWDTITIFKNTEWQINENCRHSIGKSAIFFINTDKENKNTVEWSFDQGEMMVVNDSAFIKYPLAYSSFPLKKYLCNDKTSEMPCLPVSVIHKGIRLYLSNLELINKELEENNVGEETAFKDGPLNKLPYNEFLHLLIEDKRNRN